MRHSSLYGAATFALLMASASVLAPTAATALVGGGEADLLAPGARTHRVARQAVQDRLDRQPAWTEFQARRGGQWTALWDEATRTPARFWGTGWEVDAAALATEEGAFAIAASILAEERALLGGIGVDSLRPLVVDRTQGITTVSFAQEWDGLAVHGARISLRFKAGRFVMGQLESAPGIALPRDAAPALDGAQAADVALASMGWRAVEASVGEATLVVFPILREQSVGYRLAWKLELTSRVAPSRRIAFVDAQEGALLAWSEQVRFASATLAAEHDDRYPERGLTVSPLAEATALVDGVEVTADPNGLVTVSPDAQVSWTAGSRHFRVRTVDGEELARFTSTVAEDGQALVAAPDGALDATKARRVRAQLDTHVASHIARERALRIHPTFSWANTRVDATVNSDEMSCNAWFDGDINFVVQGDGCNNTGRVADVVFHEYGHGFHGYSIIQGVGAFDGALSEGMGDYLAATITGDPGTARGFFVGSDEPLRDIEINRVWPDHVGEIHQTGRIIAGALWDARKALIAAHGEEAGIAQADQLFLAVASRASDIPTSYAEALLADDENGDLADGTPNQCAIDDAFGLHGLGPAASDLGLFGISHTGPMGTFAVAQDLPISAQVALSRPACTTGEVGDVILRWSHGDTPFASRSMASGADGDWVGAIPAAPAATTVRYAIEVRDAAGDVAGLLPQGPVTDPWFEVFVGEPTVFFASDFEDDDGGFTHDLITGNADSEGADDWRWGVPRGLAGDPEQAASGERAWGNDLALEENWNGAYQPNVHNVLTSPIVDVGADNAGVYLQFRRWLTVEDGFFDLATVSVNGATVWTQHAGEDEDDAGSHHEDTRWAFRSYDITDLVNPNGTVQVTWELVSDGGLQLGGWTLDDVAIVGFRAGTGPDLPLGAEGCGCSAGGEEPVAGWGLLGLLGAGALRSRRRA